MEDITKVGKVEKYYKSKLVLLYLIFGVILGIIVTLILIFQTIKVEDIQNNYEKSYLIKFQILGIDCNYYFEK